MFYTFFKTYFHFLAEKLSDPTVTRPRSGWMHVGPTVLPNVKLPFVSAESSPDVQLADDDNDDDDDDSSNVGKFQC